MTSPVQTGVPDLNEIVERIRADDPKGLEMLYAVFARGVRYYLLRQLGPQDLDDKVHDTFIVAVQAIRRGELREPGRLMGFVRTIVRRQVAAHIERLVAARQNQADVDPAMTFDTASSPEEDAIARQQRELALEVLRSVSSRDREILTRFYLQGQSQEQICREMGLSDTQFRLLKSRAKARFGELGRRRLNQRLPAFLVRIVPGLENY